MRKTSLFLTLALLALATLSLRPGAVRAQEMASASVEALKLLSAPGHLGIMRHATAPGGGDPAGFRLDDCATQRNLSDAGREEARAMGRAIRASLGADALARLRVRSSQWCRCLETARLLDLGAVEPWPLVNSYFGAPEKGPAQIAALKAALATLDLTAPLVLVSHHTVVIGLAGVAPASGEMVILRREPSGALVVAARVPASR